MSPLRVFRAARAALAAVRRFTRRRLRGWPVLPLRMRGPELLEDRAMPGSLLAVGSLMPFDPRFPPLPDAPAHSAAGKGLTRWLAGAPDLDAADLFVDRAPVEEAVAQPWRFDATEFPPPRDPAEEPVIGGPFLARPPVPQSAALSDGIPDGGAGQPAPPPPVADQGVASWSPSEVPLANTQPVVAQVADTVAVEPLAESTPVGSSAPPSAPQVPASDAAASAPALSGTVRIGFNHANLDGWDVFVHGGTDAGKGSVRAGSALLVEGDSFLVGLDRTFVVAPNPSPLVFRYTDLSFDFTDPDSMNDAFEVSLTDPDGRPLVYPFGDAGDGFFNISEEFPLASGAGVAETGGAVKTVTLDMSGVAPGTAATIRFRLVNNDQDMRTTVRILEVEVPAVNVPPELPAIPPQAATEGQPLALTTPFTDPDDPGPHTAVVDWGDGTTSAGTVTRDPSGNLSVSAAHPFADDGVYAARLTVTDALGASASAPFVVTVGNADPVVSVPGVSFRAPVAGSSLPRVVLTADFTDPGFTSGAAGTAETFIAEVEWGDGTTSPAAVEVVPGAAGTPSRGRVTAARTYAQAGVYTPRVVVYDDDAGVGSAVAARFGVARLTVTRALDFPAGGSVPVLVMRDAGFDATQIVPSSVRFAPAGVRPANNVMQVRPADVRFNFPVAQTGAHQGDTSAFLTGRLADGTPFASVAPVTVVGGNALPTPSPGGPAKFFVADASADRSFRYGAGGADAGSFAHDVIARDPRGAASTAAGDKVWVIDGVTHAVTVQGPDGSLLGYWRAEGLQTPTGVATDGADVWAVDASSRKVFRYAGAAAQLAGSAVAAASFPLNAENASPSDLVTDGQMVWVTDDVRDEVFVYDTLGAFLGRWTLDAANADASGITRDPSGQSADLWVVDRADKLVYTYAGGSAWREGSHPASATFALSVGNAQPEGLADPPVVTLAAPVDGASVPAGQTVVVTGRATDGAVPASPILVNGAPAEVVDAAGNFFSRVEVGPGVNTVSVTAGGASGQTTRTASVRGTQPGGIDFSLLTEVTGSATGVYRRTAWADAADELTAEASVRNDGQYDMTGPVVVGVRNISDPTVRLLGAAGTTPDGVPYLDLTALSAGGRLAPGESTAPFALQFHNPSRARFTYDLVVFTRVNQPPAIVSVPVVEGVVGRAYRYDADAVDLDGDAVAFALAAAPDGMSIDPATGVIAWAPAAADRGAHSVTVRATDGRGGGAEQSFVVSVTDAPPNRPPVFVTIPVVDARVGVEYRYASRAADPDGDTLTYSVESGPAGLAIDPATGVVTWTPGGTAPPMSAVVLRVEDGRGGAARQLYSIRLAGAPGNSPPVIVSQPVTRFDMPGVVNPATGNVNPPRIDLDLLPGQTSTRDVSLTLPPVGAGQSFADIVLVVDESGSMAGEHDWLEQMVLNLDAALQARGIGPNRFILTGFAGNGVGSDAVRLFNMLQGSTVTYYSGSNAQVAQSTLAAVLPDILLDVTATGGEQLLALANNAGLTGAYGYRVIAPTTTTAAAAVGTVVTGTIAGPGDVSRFTFSLPTATRVYFDALSAPAGFTWSLSGPAGAAVTNRSFAASDGSAVSGNPLLTLPAGDYVLTVTGPGVSTGSFQFALRDAAAATALTLGTPVSGTLAQASETDLYKFDAAAGDRFYFDAQTRTGAPGAVWRLVDPYGTVVFGSTPLGLSTDVDVVTLAQAGTYTLLVEGAFADTAAGTYTFGVVPSVVGSVPLALGARADGAVGAAGEQDAFTFTVGTRTLGYFDTLTNNPALTWTLVGPAGPAFPVVTSRALSTSENANPVLSLAAGAYTLTVDGTGAATGAYSFRVSDLGAATPVAPGTPVAGSLDPANETDIFTFGAAAGDRVTLDLTARAGASTARWRLVDPLGNAVFSTTFTSVTTSDSGPHTLAMAGAYTVLVEGAVADLTPSTYSFAVVPLGNVPPPSPGGTPLALGAVVSGDIAAAGEQDRYTFAVPARTLGYFDSLTNASALVWSLTGPAGAAFPVVTNRAFNVAESGQPVLSLAAGEYALTVDGTGAGTGAYTFRLSDLGAATAVTPGTPASGSLDPGNETDLFAFAAAAGDRVYLDVTARGGATTGTWRLFDPLGNQVFTSAFANTTTSDSGPHTLAMAGAYTLLVEAPVTQTAAATYTFNVTPAPLTTAPLALGTQTDGAISAAGESDRYTFTLADRAALYFDSLTNSANFNWTLVGPGGTAVNARTFNTADNGNPVLNLSAGEYTLTVDAAGDVTGAYSFRLSDLATATALNPGTPVSGSFEANESVAYRFVAGPGNQFYFDTIARTGATSATWRLIDPFGNNVSTFTNLGFGSVTTDVDVRTLAAGGVYTLLIEGNVAQTGTATSTFNVVPVAISSTPLALGSVTSGGIGAPGESDRYTFTLADRARLSFDSLTNSASFNWTLTGPTGAVVSARAFNAADNGLAALNLSAGEYTLTVDAAGDVTGAYSFRLSDLGTAIPLSPGTQVSGAFEANESVAYQFTGEAGTAYYFDVTARAGATSATWRLIDPFGNNVPAFTNLGFGNVNTDVELRTLPVPGTYTLLIEGNIAQTGTATYTFGVVPLAVVSSPLALGARADGSIGAAGEQDAFTFTVGTRTLAYFDTLTNSAALTWTLIGPAGPAFPVVTGRAFSTSENGVAVLNLAAGAYTLAVDGTGAGTGAYAFRLSDLGAGTPVTPGTPVSGALDPASETDAYTFGAAAGDRVTLDLTARAGANAARWRLIDPVGNAVFSTTFTSTTTSDSGPHTLAMGGTYTVLVEGAVADLTANTYAFAVVPLGNFPPVSPGGTPLTLGAVVSDAIAAAGEQDRYTFTVPARTLGYFDSLTNASSLVWSLVGPAGAAFPLVTNRALNVAESGQPVLSLPAGEYALTVAGTGAATGAYAFRVSDLAAATAVTPGTPVSGALDPGNETDAFTFAVSAGDRVYFDVTARGGATTGSWRLFDPLGNQVFTSAFASTASDSGPHTLAMAGAYTLLVEAPVTQAAAATYTFNVTPAPLNTTPLTLGATVSGSLAAPGEEDAYTFTGLIGQRVFFDALEGPTTFAVRLVAPSGAVAFTTTAAANSGPLFLAEAGTYRLVFDGTTDATGAYSFRLSDLAAAPLLTIGQETTGAIDPVRETDLFRVTAPAGQRLLVVPAADLFHGTAAQAAAATNGLVTSAGGLEDGYHGITYGLGVGSFRPGAAVNVVLVTDEDRDVTDPAATFASTFTALSSRGALLNSINDASFRDTQNQVVLGVDSKGTGYLADGAGGYTQVSGGKLVAAFGTTGADYVNLAWATTGASWDLNQLRAGGNAALSFTKAFVDIKAREIEEQIRLTVVASDPAAGFLNLTGELVGVVAGETATFSARITGDGKARSFDLLFVRPGTSVVVGSIPVTIGNDYVSPSRAIDADGDTVTFRLAEAPSGATVDPATGRVAWEPPAPGTYRFVLEASDGRGGFDLQPFDVVVTRGAPNQAPAITSAAPTTATASLPSAHTVTATDADGDLLAFYLTQAPAGMAIDRATGRITWTPPATPGGPHDVRVRVLDGRGGEAVQAFALTVVADTLNRDPVIGSTPGTVAIVGQEYRYAVAVTDPDADALILDAPLAPAGLALDPATGVVTWTPVAGQVGDQVVVVRARDGRGGVAAQSFTVTVFAAGTPPVLTAPPPAAPAVVGLPYAYTFPAQDPDGGPLVFRLDVAPPGMAIHPTTGVLTWTPTAGQIGPNPVTVAVSDPGGNTTRVSFNLPVVVSAPNDPPVISSAPPVAVALSETYLYRLAASDPNNDALAFSVVTGPPGLAIDASGIVTWTPAAAQLGPHAVTLRVSDGRGGADEQSFTVEVLSRAANRSPVITSVPPRSATADEPFRYDAAATDPDGDPLAWELVTAPLGMSIDADRGTIRWTPSIDQLGQQLVVVRVTDGAGFAEQTFTLTVRGVNLPPLVTSTPPTTGAVGSLYAYPVRATDPDGDPLTFALVAPPAGMDIDPTTGVITWTPAATGPFAVTVRATDDRGGIAEQSFSVVVAAAGPNRPPVVTSRAVTAAAVGTPYTYAATAVDPEGQPVTYGLAVFPAGMTIDPTTGFINWTPAAGQEGSATVVVTVTDGETTGSQRYAVSVIANRAPTIASSPVASVFAGATYRYDVRAVDPDGDPLGYSLEAGPTGLTIDALGRLAWATGPADVGPHAVEVVVADGRGGSARQPFTLTVVADAAAPQVAVRATPNPVNVGGTVTLQLLATDNVAVTTTTLLVGGVPVPLDANGTAVYPADTVGLFAVVALATDPSGNEGTATIQLRVVNPQDTEAPHVTITSPTNGATVGGPVQVIGTVDDADDQLDFYRVYYGRADLVDPTQTGWDSAAGRPNDPDYVQIGGGTAEVIDGPLATFDPTILSDDDYHLLVAAFDVSGRGWLEPVRVSVAGGLKLGEFSLTTVDLSIPLAGIPVEVTRTYSTLKAGDRGDFGYGWSLGLADAQVRETVAQVGFGFFTTGAPFRAGTRVFLTNPEGRRVSFVFQPTPTAALLGAAFRPKFVPDPGVTDRLDVDNITLSQRADGTFVFYLFGIPYNPDTYRLTTKDGVTYEYDQFAGLRKVTDRNGATLTYGRDGITSSTGVAVRFVRDPQGRVAQVIDPDGGIIRYGYDAAGNLTSVTDQAGRVSRFTYRSDRPHYLDEAFDPLGNRLSKTEYDAQGRPVGMANGLNQTTTTVYDPSAFTETVTDPLGHPTAYTYDARGNVLAETDPLGRTRSYTYDANDNKLTATDPLARTTVHTYDARRNLLSETDARGGVTRYEYNALNLLTKVTDPLGRVTVYLYDAKGNPTGTVDGTGGVTRRTNDATGRALAETNENGNTTTYQYASTASDGPTRVTHPDGTFRTIAYNGLGLPGLITDERGEQSALGYNASGQLLSVRDPEGGVTRYAYTGDLVTVRTDPLGRTTAYSYDAARRLTRQTDALGGVTLYSYDALGRQTSTTDPLGHSTVTAYRPDGRAESVTDAMAGVTAYEYDAAGNRTTEIDALGRRRNFGFDELNRLVRKDDCPCPDETYTYDAAGNLTSLTDKEGRTTRYALDAMNRLVRLTDAMGGVKRWAYDGLGSVTAVTDANGHSTRYQYDARNRLTRTTDPAGFSTTAGFDGAGNRTSATDELGNTTFYSYDGAGRMLSATDPDGGVTAHTYDLAGNRLSMTNPLGQATAYEYDALNRLVEVTDAEGGVKAHEYDAAGNLIALTDQVGNRTTFGYDDLNRRVRETDAAGLDIVSGYDAVGNLTELTDRNGRRRTFEYDDLNRLTDEVWWDGPAAVRTVTADYDSVGNLLSVTDPSATYTFTYDDLNRQRTVDNAGTPGAPHVVLTSEYDAVGNRLRITDGAGVTVDSTYDARDLLAVRTWHGGGVSDARLDFAYDARGDRTDIDRYADLTATLRVSGSTISYDDLGRVAAMSHAGAGGPVSAYGYTYDAASRLVQEVRNGTVIDYSHDLLGQLVEADRATGPDEAYAYDDAGNREGGGYATTAANRTTSDGTFEYDYDGEGNLVLKTETATGAETEYEYDLRNRLVGVTARTAGGIVLSEARYTYDALDRRIAVAADGVTTFTAYDGNATWADYDATGGALARYLLGDEVDEMLARWRPGEGTAWYLTDKLGTVRDLLGAVGALLNRIDYDSFGRILGQTNAAAGDRFTFTGREFDAATGLYYYRARFYDPVLGRFTSEDPIRFAAGDFNLFRYVYNAVLDATDPTGLISSVEYAKLQRAISARVAHCAKLMAASIPGAALSEVALYIFLANGVPYIGRTVQGVNVRGQQHAVRLATQFNQLHLRPILTGIKIPPQYFAQIEQAAINTAIDFFGGHSTGNYTRPGQPGRLMNKIRASAKAAFPC